MPTLMAPAIHEVNSWLSGRLVKVKKSKETDTSAAATKSQRTKDKVTAREATRGHYCNDKEPKGLSQGWNEAAFVPSQVSWHSVDEQR
jgi:hypothetical protein